MATLGLQKQLASDLETISGNFIVIDRLMFDFKNDQLHVFFNIYQDQVEYKAGSQPVNTFSRVFLISQLPAGAKTILSNMRDNIYTRAANALPFLSGAAVVTV